MNVGKCPNTLSQQSEVQEKNFVLVSESLKMIFLLNTNKISSLNKEDERHTI